MADIGSILGGLTGMYSALTNYYSQADTNRKNVQMTNQTNLTNREIAELNNKANLDLYREQYANNVVQWMRENEYNSPSSQVSRLRAAGLNPALVLGGSGEVGVAGSASMPSANPMTTGAPQVAAHLQAPLVNFSDVFQNMAMAAQSVKTSEEAKSMNISNQYAHEQKRLELRQIRASIRVALSQEGLNSTQKSYYKALDNYYAIQERFLDTTFDSRKQSIELNNQYTAANKQMLEQSVIESASRVALNQSITALNKKQDEYFVRHMEAMLSKLYSDISVNSANVNLITTTEIQKRAETEGIEISNEQARELKPYIVEQGKYVAAGKKAEVAEINSRTALNKQGVKESKSRTSLNQSKEKLNKQESSLYPFKVIDATLGTFNRNSPQFGKYKLK